MMEKFGVEKSEMLNHCRIKVFRGEMTVEEALAKCRRHGLEDITKDEFLKG